MRGWTKERKEIIRSLRRVSLFADCTDKELVRVDGLLTELDVSIGKTLMGRGSAKLQFMIVCDGYGEVTSDGQSIGRVGPGSHIGERSFQGENWNAKVTALTAMRILILNAGELATLMQDVPSVAAKIEQESPTRTVAEPVVLRELVHG